MATVVHVIQLILDREGRSPPTRSRGQQSGRMTRANEIKRNSCSIRVAAAISDKLSGPASHHLLLTAGPSGNSSQTCGIFQIARARIDLINVSFHGSHPSSHWLKLFIFSPPPPFLHAQKKPDDERAWNSIDYTTTYQDIIPSVVAGRRDDPQLLGCFFFFEDCQLFLSSLICWLSLFQTIKSLKFKREEEEWHVRWWY